jgi:amino acid permease
MLDRLPPFWAVALILFGLTVPQSLLALPIAAAEVGTWPALGVLALLGTLMSLCIAGETEALARDGEFRSKGGYYGKLVARYLGARAASIPTALAGLRTALSVLAGYVGLCVTLASLTGVPRTLWGVLAIVILAVALIRGGVRTPSSIGGLIGLACVPLLAIIAGVAVAHASLHNLTSAGRTQASEFGDFIGTVLILYMGSVYVVGVARDKLPSDPSGRGLIWGSAVATLATTAIAALWLVAVTAALPASKLSGQVGTVLDPLASEFGAVVSVPGVILTLLLLGLGTERAAVALMDLVEERGPSRRALPIIAPLAICVLGEVLLDLGAVSFTGVFNAAGLATNVVLGLAVPVLLLAVSRRTGDLTPGIRVPLLGRRVVAGALLAADFLLLLALATVLSDGTMVRVVSVASLAALAELLWLCRRLPSR